MGTLTPIVLTDIWSNAYTLLLFVMPVILLSLAFVYARKLGGFARRSGK